MAVAFNLPKSLMGKRIHLVGAKGTGVAALAEILSARGASLSGSDVADYFYTDEILKDAGVAMNIGFSAANLPGDAEIVIHSAAYSRDSNPELLEAASRQLPILSYPEALGELSLHSISAGICGVHGKTTTTAFSGSLAKALDLPATVLAGSAVASFGGRCTVIRNDRFFIAETCEYRRHFLAFHPSRIVLTSIESDHQDFFPTFDDIFKAFIDYIRLLPQGGELIYCADDAGASKAAQTVSLERRDIRLCPYGQKAEGPYRLADYRTGSGKAMFRLEGFEQEFVLHVPGQHLALDAAAALALTFSILCENRNLAHSPASLLPQDLVKAAQALADFSGSKRRSEVLGEVGGVLFMDDYGHHPTAIRDTIQGIKEFWPDRRLIVDFMSHTYSRTKALFDEFAGCLGSADVVVMHGIYPSAREEPDPSISGKSLFEAAKAHALPGTPFFYFENVLEGKRQLLDFLKPGDLFLTMGAGDNWKLGVALKEELEALQ